MHPSDSSRQGFFDREQTLGPGVPRPMGSPPPQARAFGLRSQLANYGGAQAPPMAAVQRPVQQIDPMVQGKPLMPVRDTSVPLRSGDRFAALGGDRVATASSLNDIQGIRGGRNARLRRQIRRLRRRPIGYPIPRSWA